MKHINHHDKAEASLRQFKKSQEHHKYAKEVVSYHFLQVNYFKLLGLEFNHHDLIAKFTRSFCGSYFYKKAGTQISE